MTHCQPYGYGALNPFDMVTEQLLKTNLHFDDLRYDDAGLVLK